MNSLTYEQIYYLLTIGNPYYKQIQLGYDIYYFWTRGKFDIEKYTSLEGVRA